MAEKIKDFGEKIGGARKDIWRASGISVNDIIGLTDEEKDYYINRDMVWPIPKSKELVENGMDVLVAFWQREIRKKIRKYPLILNTDDKGQIQEGYIQMVGKIRDRVMKINSTSEFAVFFDEVRNEFGDPGMFRRCSSGNDMYNLKYELSNMRYRCQKQNFPYGHGNTSRKARKRSFPMPLLEHIRRDGRDVRHGRMINADIWQREFSFRGVEFGNWLSQKDRQDSMNYCYEALHDLSDALRIDKKDIAFGGELALAFGARGRSGAASHYEFMRRVINLTKIHGAGTLAHEWAYALDHMLARFYGIDDTKFASCSKQSEKLPEVLNKLYRSMVKDEDGNRTDFLRGSIEFDRSFRRGAYGDWSSRLEMFARAFACYVKDELGYSSDYLMGYADVYVFEFENQGYSAIPQGEEREILNELFDILVYRLKQDGFFHERKEEPKPVLNHKAVVVDVPVHYRDDLSEDRYGQLVFSF